MIQPSKSTQLVVLREQWGPRVPNGAQTSNLHGSWRLAHQNDRRENADQILGLREPKSDSSIHQNCQLVAATGSRRRRRAASRERQSSRGGIPDAQI